MEPAWEGKGGQERPASPVPSTTETLRFTDDHARDRFYVWLIDRLDRWQSWASIARLDGAEALSERFLALAHADRLALDRD